MLEMIVAIKVVVTSAKYLSEVPPCSRICIPFRLLLRYRPSISETMMAMF